MKSGFFRRKLGKFLIAVLVVAVSSVLFTTLLKRLFALETIVVVGNDIHVSIDNKKLPTNLIFFPGDKIREEVLAGNPWLSDVQFQKVYPHTLKIIPIVRTPYIRLQSNNRIVLVDASGVVLQDGDQGLSIPLFVVDAVPFHMGERIGDPRMKFLLTFMDAIYPVLPIESITEYDDTYYQVKSGTTAIYITQDKSVDVTIATLQTLMTGFRIKGTLPTVVDLRFDKPIIKF